MRTLPPGTSPTKGKFRAVGRDARGTMVSCPSRTSIRAALQDLRALHAGRRKRDLPKGVYRCGGFRRGFKAARTVDKVLIRGPFRSTVADAVKDSVKLQRPRTLAGVQCAAAKL